MRRPDAYPQADPGGTRSGARYCMRLSSTPRALCLHPGWVDERRARLWFRVPGPGPYELVLDGPGGTRRHRLAPEEVSTRGGTGSILYPDDLGAEALWPDARYRAWLEPLDEGADAAGEESSPEPDGSDVFEPSASFRTSPAAPGPLRRYALGFGSCHQPFDEEGRVDPERLRLLSGLPELFRRHRVERVLLLGDQMYADQPRFTSLFSSEGFREVAPAGRASILECSRAEVRRIYQDRYRAFFGVRELDALLAAFPCTMVLDDHDVIDNFGSDPRHASPAWSNLRAGAIDAYWDYQASRARAPRDPSGPRSGAHSFRYSALRVFVMDLRAQRRVAGGEGRIADEPQWAELEGFLEASGPKDVLVLALSVPLVHLPDLVSKATVPLLPDGSAMDDRWSAPHLRPCRDRLLRLLEAQRRRWPDQVVVLLGGDIHIGMAHELRFPGHRPIYQLVSSGLSNPESTFLQMGSAWLARLAEHRGTSVGDPQVQIQRLSAEKEGDNPFLGLNAGLVEVEETSGPPRVRLALVGARKRGDAPFLAFRSPWLGGR